MRVKTKMLGLALITAVALACPMVLAHADDGGGYGGHWGQDGDQHHGNMEHMMAKILGLTDDQVKQLKDLHQKQKETMKTEFEQIKANREAFNQEIVKASPDMGKITDLQTQLKTIQSQMIDDRLNSILAIKKIMTPEQYAGYAALKKEKMMKMHMMGHGKFGHKDGFGKDGDNHQHWGDKGDGDHGFDGQD